MVILLQLSNFSRMLLISRSVSREKLAIEMRGPPRSFNLRNLVLQQLLMMVGRDDSIVIRHEAAPRDGARRRRKEKHVRGGIDPPVQESNTSAEGAYRGSTACSGLM